MGTADPATRMGAGGNASQKCIIYERETFVAGALLYEVEKMRNEICCVKIRDGTLKSTSNCMQLFRLVIR